MRCSGCGTGLAEGAKFCNQCGMPVMPGCAGCGSPNPPGARFCSDCGSPLAAGTAPVVEAVDRGRGRERRLVTVLFADLVGYTSFSESRDAEEVRAMLSDYFEVCRRLIGSYGGTIEKFIGDAVMAVWGVPIAHEDDAERAVRAAMDLVAGVTALGTRLALPELTLRAGVLSGEAAVDLDATAEGMVIGDAVNTAARIQSLAAPGTVRVDDTTRLLTERSIVYTDAGAHAVKGKVEPVQTWRPTRVVGSAGGVRRTVTVEVPFVGRATELAALKAVLTRLTEPGAALEVVTVVGEAGLGKSRLAWELEKYLDGLATDFRWHHGRCSRFEDGGISFALVDMLRGRAAIAADDPVAEQRAKVETMLDAHFGDDRDGRHRARRGILRLLALDEAGEPMDRSELFAGARLLFERLAADMPVVIVIEEAHWADRGVLDFVVHLREWSARLPILVLAFGRPGDQTGELGAHGSEIRLAPLADEHIDALVTGAVSGAPAGLVERIRAQAEGFPLYAVETLRVLADRGALRVAGEHYEVAGDVAALELPASIHALIAARLDALGPLERRTLLQAAVLGQSFSVPALAALSAAAQADARTVLDALVAKQLLVVNRDPLSAERGRYGFLQTTVQRVAYGTISRVERKRLHRAAAEYLRTAANPVEVAPQLVGHLLAAAEAEPHSPEAAAIRADALTTMVTAAERAISVASQAEAIAMFTRAAEVEPDPLAAAELAERAAVASNDLNDHQRTQKLFLVAGARYADAGADREAMRTRALALYAADRAGEPSEPRLVRAREYFAAASGTADKTCAVCANVLAFTLHVDQQYAESLAMGEVASAAAEASGALAELALAFDLRVATLSFLGRPVEALACIEADLSLTREHDPRRGPLALSNAAVRYVGAGRFGQAAAVAREARAEAERTGQQSIHRHAGSGLAQALHAIGEWDEALDIIDAAAVPATLAWEMMLPVATQIALDRGDLEGAATLVERMRGFIGSLGVGYELDYVPTLTVAADVLAGVASSLVVEAPDDYFVEYQGWLPRALDLLLATQGADQVAAALSRLEALGAIGASPIVAGQTSRLRAHAAARSGAPDRADWDEPVRLAAEAGLVFLAAVGALERAENRPADPAARDGLTDAGAVFERLRARPFSERVQAAWVADLR